MSGAAPYALQGELTIARAAEWRETLLGAMAAGARCFDLSQVTEFDSAGVQLLLAARRTARQEGTGFELRSAPEVVHEVLRRYGLADALLAIVTAHLQAGDGADLQLDLSGIGHCDSAGVQLLLAARQTLRPSGARLYIGPASAVVRDVLQTYGLGSLLAQPVMNDMPA